MTHQVRDVGAEDPRELNSPTQRLIPEQKQPDGRLAVARLPQLPQRDGEARVETTEAPPAVAPLSRSRTSTILMMAADLSALALALVLADPRTVLILFVVATYAWHVQGLYGRRFTISILDDAGPLAVGATCAVAVLALVTRGDPEGQLVALTALVAGVIGGRSVAYALIRSRRRRGGEVFPALLLGSGQTAATLAERILEHPETGLRLVGWLHEEPQSGEASSPVRDLGHTRELRGVMAATPVSDVIVCGREDLLSELVDEFRVWDRSETAVHAVPTLFELHLLSRATDEVWGVPLEVVRRPGSQVLGRLAKRTMDVLISLVVMFCLLPVLAVVALAVRLEVGRGIIFRQQRVGLDGRHFSLMKFRSIPHNVRAEKKFSVLDETTIGPVGRFIRRYSLDEIPQLFNVIKGDMSLVGPRPERPEYVQRFDREIPGYRHRHRVPVGMTGLAAVIGLRGASSIRDRAYFDNLYIENWSVWLDVKVLVRTVTSVLRGTGS